MTEPSKVLKHSEATSDSSDRESLLFWRLSQLREVERQATRQGDSQRLEAVGKEIKKVRDQLILNNAYLVRQAVNQILKKGLKLSVSKDDLISEGTLGLIQAVDKYEEEAGVLFRTWAWKHIRGVILHALRREKNQTRLIEQEPTEGLEEMVFDQHDDLAAVDYEDLKQAAFASLSERERHFLQSVLDGKSTRELAAEEGISFQRVNQILWHAAEKIREQIGAGLSESI